MTCIVGLKHGNNMYVGGDSACNFGDGGRRVISQNTPKVFIKDDMIFGVSGSCKFCQILMYEVDAPLRPENISDMKYLFNHYVPHLSEIFNAHGYKNKEENEFTFLLGYKGNFYSICSDFTVHAFVDTYHVAGSGTNWALGSLYTSHKEGISDPEKVITTALEAAANFSQEVQGPFRILKI